MTSNDTLYIIGDGGHARAVKEVAEALGMSTEFIGTRYTRGIPDGACIVIGVGNRDISQGLYEASTSSHSFVRLVHPCAIVAPDVAMGEGTVIMPGAMVRVGVIIGVNCIINTGAIVDHECIIGAHSHIAPGAILAGNVVVGRGAHIGLGACIKQGLTIGEGAVVAMGAVVTQSVRAHTTVMGVPAR